MLIVDEIKPWGVQAYALVPKSNDGSTPAGQAFNRLPYGCFKKVGEALVGISPFKSKWPDPYPAAPVTLT